LKKNKKSAALQRKDGLSFIDYENDSDPITNDNIMIAAPAMTRMIKRIISGGISQPKFLAQKELIKDLVGMKFESERLRKLFSSLVSGHPPQTTLRMPWKIRQPSMTTAKARYQILTPG